MKMLRNLSRLILGLVFVFSGFVKGVDPMGTAYRIEDYLIAYGMDWGLPFGLYASVALCALEFLLGAILILNIRIKEFSWILLVLMIFFTLITFYDALYEPVPDCGCFGDAIKLSNWGTFLKNLFLMSFTVAVFLERKNFHSAIGPMAQNAFILLIAVGFTGFCMQNYFHLPVLDFRDWKVGNDMVPDDRGEAKIYLTFRNLESGETREYLSPDYPWNDSLWMAKWEFVDQRTDDSEVVRGHELVIETAEGEDVTSNYIENPDYQLLVIAYDLKGSSRKTFPHISGLYEDADHAGVSLILVTSTLPSDVDAIRDQFHPHLEIFYADDIVLKTMIRSNPGIILMKDGVVLAKWHYNDFPLFEDIRNRYLKD